MRVKVGDSWFEALPGRPIMVELTDADRARIACMSASATQYAVFHDEDASTAGERRAWMAAGAAARKPFERRWRDPRHR